MTLLERVNELLQREAWEEILVVLQDEDPGQFVHDARARCLYSLGRFDEALVILDELRDLHPENELYSLLTFHSSWNAGRFLEGANEAIRYTRLTGGQLYLDMIPQIKARLLRERHGDIDASNRSPDDD